MHVLIASDDPVARKILTRAVRARGHLVETRDDGDAAWTLFSESRPDVVLSDWVMPGKTGLELCQAIRSLPGDRYVYFILVTATDRKGNLLRAMDAGVDDYLNKPLDMTELQVRLRVAERISGIHADLARQRRELQQKNEKLHEAGRRDPLTGLWNRRQLEEDMHRMQRFGQHLPRRFCIAMCDVDAFKLYNDRYGHVEGDAILKNVAKALVRETRGSDRVYRYGGEEFLIVLPDLVIEAGRSVLGRVCGAVERLAVPHPDAGPADVVTISIGVVEVDLDEDVSFTTWTERADQALYQAKEQGRNRVVVLGEAAGDDGVAPTEETPASESEPHDE